MESKFKQIEEVLKIFEASDFTALVVEFDGVRLSVSKDRAAPDIRMLDDATACLAKGVGERDAPAQRDAIPEPATLSQPVPVREAETDDARLHVIRAPMLGTFYRSRAPGEPPFVPEGAHVDASDALCLIECMKLFNTIHAGVKGRLVRFAVKNGALIEFDQPIAYIELE